MPGRKSRRCAGLFGPTHKKIHRNNNRRRPVKHDLSKAIDQARLGPFQIGIIALCYVIVMIDGYDLAVMGAALPSIISDMKMDPSLGGMIASCALIGMMLGAIFLGALADRIGRVPTIILCVLAFSVFTAATGLAHDPLSFAALRLLAGLGLGGVLPCIMATLADYSPKRLRSRLTTITLTGYALGGVLAAMLGKHFLAEFGWRFVFFVAAAPILLIPAIRKWMPEAPALLQKRGDTASLHAIAQRLAPPQSVSHVDEVYIPLPAHQDKAPVARLFRENRGFSTLMLGLCYFAGLFMLYALNSWLPKLIVLAGYSLGTALSLLALMHTGGIFGSIAGGWLADLFGLKRVMAIMLFCGSAATALAAQHLPLWLLSTAIFVIGTTVSAGQGMAYAYASQFYPTDMRSTGVGVATGIGRLGGIAAPITIGLLISQHVTHQSVFYVIVAFGLVQTIATLLIDDRVADFASAGTTPAPSMTPLPAHSVADGVEN
ncbi:MFS transporter [Ralstonia insidiosa]|uniref:MFS transporter n=2 Tax=Ralstonia insidiosa TaxID=190721 RepID=A0A848NSJ5_9RALS|nr:MFS transporter [Ralstonia insidiosa]NMV38072.1 MFS transporter [Ralstonia insidiosa]